MTNLNYAVSDIMDAAYSQIDAATECIRIADKQCKADPETCQHSTAIISNLKQSIANAVQTLQTVNRHCGMENVPSTEAIVERALRGVDWRYFNPRTETKDNFGNIHQQMLGNMSTLLKLFIQKKRWVQQVFMAVGTLLAAVGTIYGADKVFL